MKGPPQHPTSCWQHYVCLCALYALYALYACTTCMHHMYAPALFIDTPRGAPKGRQSSVGPAREAHLAAFFPRSLHPPDTADDDSLCLRPRHRTPRCTSIAQPKQCSTECSAACSLKHTCNGLLHAMLVHCNGLQYMKCRCILQHHPCGHVMVEM